MQFKVKLLSFNEPASDSSMIPREVVEQWLASDEYKNAIASHSLLGTMSHYPRNVSSGTKNLSSAISKTVGKDDLMIIVGESAPTHYITGFECGNDGWLYATAQVLDEACFDSQAGENIKRLKGLLKSGCMIGCSAVVLGYWKSASEGNPFGTQKSCDVLHRLVSLRGFDLTLNPSWKKAQVVSVTDDDGNILHSVEQKQFSENAEVTYDGVKVKCFSDLSQFADMKAPKTSKVNGQFTFLKAKEFSSNNLAELVSEEEPVQKEYSVATLKERVRYSQFSTRMRFRRLIVEYKQVVKQMGGVEKIKPEVLKSMKSLFMADIMEMMSTLTNDITTSGKQINTVLGCSAFSKELRQAAQKLQIPYRLAFQELAKTGKLSPVRFQKLKEAYAEFAKACQDEVFNGSPISEELVTEIEQEENNG